MKVLTLHQPWASLVALGVKTVETRSWGTTYRGPLAIHASALRHRRMTCRLGQWQYGGLSQCLWRENEQRYVRDYQHVPVGAIVATCTLVDVVPIIAEDSCEWHIEHPRSVGACAHAAVDGQVIVHTPEGNYHTTVLVEQSYGDYTPGRFAFLLTDAVPVDPPVPFKGAQGLTKTWEPAS